MCKKSFTYEKTLGKFEFLCPFVKIPKMRKTPEINFTFLPPFISLPCSYSIGNVSFLENLARVVSFCVSWYVNNFSQDINLSPKYQRQTYHLKKSRHAIAHFHLWQRSNYRLIHRHTGDFLVQLQCPK